MHRWASKKLCADGEDLLGRVLLPQYLLLAQTILLAPLGKPCAALAHPGICIIAYKGRLGGNASCVRHAFLSI